MSLKHTLSGVEVLLSVHPELSRGDLVQISLVRLDGSSLGYGTIRLFHRESTLTHDRIGLDCNERIYEFLVLCLRGRRIARLTYILTVSDMAVHGGSEDVQVDGGLVHLKELKLIFDLDFLIDPTYSNPHLMPLAHQQTGRHIDGYCISGEHVSDSSEDSRDRVEVQLQ